MSPGTLIRSVQGSACITKADEAVALNQEYVLCLTEEEMAEDNIENLLSHRPPPRVKWSLAGVGSVTGLQALIRYLPADFIT
ncbi:hypothetical protein scyTo_0001829 [Scyliorhinus torazame]|uniref:Uncharacterized protein n=1 Tax=Scyliorhinus torazame TaxID=75743 RepID=A0A401PG51_SCYTO|nr:hypothetical protein [Scyliorhinus torazame]